MKAIIQCIGILICAVPAALAQDVVRVRGRFETDSISIGESIPYALTAHYPRTRQVFFPDSTFAFTPFEISRKKFFSTKTTGDTSYDSVVYWLTTFEIDSIQKLSLPIFVLQEKDCVAVVSAPDSVFLRYRVASVPDSVSVEKLPLKTNTAYQKVQWILNYPFFALLTGGLLVLLVLAWIIFGKRIRRYFALRKLNKSYQEFIIRFNQALERLGSESNSRKAEEALVTWKDYMEGLEQYPYTKFTSREIVKLVGDHTLDNALRAIDRSIYGGLSSSLEPFRSLLIYSEQRFKKKEEEVRNG